MTALARTSGPAVGHVKHKHEFAGAATTMSGKAPMSYTAVVAIGANSSKKNNGKDKMGSPRKNIKKRPTSAVSDSSPQQMLLYNQTNLERKSYASVVRSGDNSKRILRRPLAHVAKLKSWPPSPNYFFCDWPFIPATSLKRSSADDQWHVRALHSATSTNTSATTPSSTTKMQINLLDRSPSLSCVETVHSPTSTYSSSAESCFTESCDTSSTSLTPLSATFSGYDLYSGEQSQAAHARFLRQDTELMPRPASAQRALSPTEESISVWGSHSAHSALTSLFDRDDDDYLDVEYARALANRDALRALGGPKYFFQRRNVSQNAPCSAHDCSDNGSSEDEEAPRTPPPSQDAVWLSGLWDVTTHAPDVWGPIDFKELNRDAWITPVEFGPLVVKPREKGDLRRHCPTTPLPKPYDGSADQALSTRFVHESAVF